MWKLDRLGRNLHHLVNTVHDLTARGIGLKVLTGQGVHARDQFTQRHRGDEVRPVLLERRHRSRRATSAAEHLAYRLAGQIGVLLRSGKAELFWVSTNQL